MNTLQIKYRTAGKGLRPQSIRMTSPELDRLIRAKMDQMPELQPISFADGANYGFELVYQYQTECHVVNDNGEVRIYWDYAKEPGGVMGWDEFTDTVPKPSNSFIFATSVDLQAPPGYVLRTETHPRFYTDNTGTVPPALCGQVRTEWWPKKLFVVFKAPPRGQRYIFRKGEPYAQILFVPQDAIYEPKPMNAESRPESGAPPDSNHVDFKYRTIGKAFPPQSTRLEVPGWGGSPEIKMENGSEPQPWHCSPFREGAMHGIELLFQYDSECQVINENGQLRFDRGHAKEAGGVPGDNEFFEIGPKPCQFYGFDTSVVLQAPPGEVLRTESHPRYFTDRSGDVPVAVCGHVQTDEPRKLCVVFKAPAPGQRHVFRTGEPYIQILFVPQPMTYETIKMSSEEETRRKTMEDGIFYAKTYIAKHVWHNPVGLEFNDHYRVLQRAFERDGVPGVQATIEAAVKYMRQIVPQGKTIVEYLKLADDYKRAGKHLEAKEILVHARGLDPNNPEVANRIGLLQWNLGLRSLGLGAMESAVRLQPHSAEYHGTLGEMLRQLGRLDEAIVSLRFSLYLNPNDAQVRSRLNLALAAQER